MLLVTFRLTIRPLLVWKSIPNPAFTLEKAASVADDNIFSEFDVDTNPIVELSGLSSDIDLVEVFVIGANAADTVDADNVVGTEDGVVKKTYDLGDAAAGVISVPITQSDVNKLGQDGTDVFVRVTDVHGNTSVNNIGNLLIHTGTVLENEAGDVGLGEVVENGFTLGTKFIPHDTDVAGALDIIANPETGVTEVRGDKINFGAFSDDVYVDAGFGAVIVRNDEGMVGNAKLSLAINDASLVSNYDTVASNLETAQANAANLAKVAQEKALMPKQKPKTQLLWPRLQSKQKHCLNPQIRCG